MIFIKIGVTLCAAILGISADVSPGLNAYLPPDKGYNYPKPPKPFPTPTRPPVTRPSVTPPTFTPTRPTFTPTRPTFTPTRPSYGPPTFTPTRPSYGPPTFTPTRPTGVTPTRPTYRPTPPTHRPPIDGSPSDNHDHHDHHHHHEPGMPFDFAYAVNDVEHGNDYSHNAVSDGDITRGEYRIQLPDGRLQVVKYTADWKNGFNAQVSYEGQPSYPQPGGTGYKY